MNVRARMVWGLGALSLVAVLSCGSSSSSSGAGTVFGNWIYTNAAGTGAVGISINENDTYVVYGLTLTSTTTANATEEIGSVVVTPTTVTFNPQQSTCRVADPSYTANYTVNGSTLNLGLPTADIGLHSNTTPASDDYVLSLGCDNAAGTFTIQALAPVQP